MYFAISAPRDASADEQIDFERTKDLWISYLFYYREDFGGGGHCGDLERLVVRIVLVHSKTGVSVAVPYQYEGTAHGNAYLSNILFQDRHGFSLPMTVLVEEGKHATCPDRNGDGYYTPGYDVNYGGHDAWGVRDSFGSSLVSSAYSPADTKPTRAQHPEARVFPPLDAQDGLRRRWQADAASRAWGDPLSVYELQWSRDPRFLSAGRDPHDPAGFVEPSGARDAFSFMWKYPTLSYRDDGARRGVAYSLAVFPLPLIKYRIGPRFTWMKGDGVYADVMLSPSVSRLADWYAAASVKKGPTWFAKEFEAGIRLRLKLNKFRDRLPMFGARFGIRTHGSDVSKARFIFEIGGGPS